MIWADRQMDMGYRNKKLEHSYVDWDNYPLCELLWTYQSCKNVFYSNLVSFLDFVLGVITGF